MSCHPELRKSYQAKPHRPLNLNGVTLIVTAFGVPTRSTPRYRHRVCKRDVESAIISGCRGWPASQDDPGSSAFAWDEVGIPGALQLERGPLHFRCSSGKAYKPRRATSIGETPVSRRTALLGTLLPERRCKQAAAKALYRQ